MGSGDLHRYGRVTDRTIRHAKTRPVNCSRQRWEIELRRRNNRKKLGGYVPHFDPVESENRVIK